MGPRSHAVVRSLQLAFTLSVPLAIKDYMGPGMIAISVYFVVVAFVHFGVLTTRQPNRPSRIYHEATAEELQALASLCEDDNRPGCGQGGLEDPGLQL